MADSNLKSTISNYYDSLIEKIKTYTDEQLEKYAQDDLIKLGKVKKVEETPRTDLDLDTASDLISDEAEDKAFQEPDGNKNLASVTAKRSDFSDKSRPNKAQEYLSQIRYEMICELKRIQKETLEGLTGETDIEKACGKQFAVLFGRAESADESNRDPAGFQLYLVVLDFYLDEYQRNFFK